MKTLAIALALLAMLTPTAARADCTAPSADALAEVARAILSRIRILEQQLPTEERKPRPSLTLRITDELETPEVNSTVPQDMRAHLAERSCIDKDRLRRNIVSSLQEQAPSLAVISSLANRDLEAIASRISAIGVGNIDRDTVTRLRAFDLNYVVVVGGRSAVTRSGCGFTTRFLADTDVHSLATTEVLQASAIPALISSAPADISRVATGYIINNLDGTSVAGLRIAAHVPICPYNSEVEFDDVDNKYELTWRLNLGCLRADESRDYSTTVGELYGTGWPERGRIIIRPKSSCGHMTFAETAIRMQFAPNWRPPPPPGLPQGAQLRACACWGPGYFNVPFPHSQCSSGYAVHLGCPAVCASGFQYRTVCQ